MLTVPEPAHSVCLASTLQSTAPAPAFQVLVRSAQLALVWVERDFLELGFLLGCCLLP